MENKKLTKRQLQKFAIMHVSTHAQYLDGSGFDNCNISEDEIQKCVEAVQELSFKISKGLPTNITHKKGILDYVRKHF